MYQSYKFKRKKRRVYRYFFILLILAGLFYTGNKYKQYIFFWKYTSNKLSRELDAITAGPDNERLSRLQEISRICADYCAKNQTSAESYLLMGKIYYYLAEKKLNKSFSDFIIYDNSNVPEQVNADFLNAIKYIRKGIALSRSEKLQPEYRLLLAKAYYFSGYYGRRYIFETIERPDPGLIKNIEDIRFISVTGILAGEKDFGIDILEKFDIQSQDIKDKFFNAKAYDLAGRYTDAIIKFKNILDICTDNQLKKLANINLGTIFFNQSLYKESLVHFINAFILDGNDNNLKIWIGKNYSALGDKKKAKQIWSEVLAADQNNMEVKKLLGIM